MDVKTTNQNLPSEKLIRKFAELRDQHGVEDLKFWVHKTGPDEASVEDVASEVLSIVELYESGNYEDITATIDKRDE
jgi:hypothetical protein